MSKRPSEGPGFGRGDYDGDSLRLRRNKFDKPLVPPCTEALRMVLDSAKAAVSFTPMPNHPNLGVRDRNRLTQRRLSEWMLAERKLLGVEAFDLQALRYRGVMELAWAGCDDDEIMCYSGQAAKAMVIEYAGEARQILRTRQAREKHR